MSDVVKDNQLHVPDILLEDIGDNRPKIKVSRSIGFTVNLQGYESARVDATIEISGDLKNKDLIKEQVSKELESEISKQIAEIVEQHDPNKTLLGYHK